MYTTVPTCTVAVWPRCTDYALVDGMTRLPYEVILTRELAARRLVRLVARPPVCTYHVVIQAPEGTHHQSCSALDVDDDEEQDVMGGLEEEEE